jgi:hypothetical protein
MRPTPTSRARSTRLITRARCGRCGRSSTISSTATTTWRPRTCPTRSRRPPLISRNASPPSKPERTAKARPTKTRNKTTPRRPRPSSASAGRRPANAWRRRNSSSCRTWPRRPTTWCAGPATSTAKTPTRRSTITKTLRPTATPATSATRTTPTRRPAIAGTARARRPPRKRAGGPASRASARSATSTRAWAAAWTATRSPRKTSPGPTGPCPSSSRRTSPTRSSRMGSVKGGDTASMKAKITEHRETQGRRLHREAAGRMDRQREQLEGNAALELRRLQGCRRRVALAGGPQQQLL